MDNSHHTQHDPGAPLPEGAFDPDRIALAYVEALREMVQRQDAGLEAIERLAACELAARPVEPAQESAGRLWRAVQEIRRLAAAARRE